MKLQEVVQTYTIKSQSTTSSVELGKGRWETEVKKEATWFQIDFTYAQRLFLAVYGGLAPY